MGLLGVRRMSFSNTAPDVQQELHQGVWLSQFLRRVHCYFGCPPLWGPVTALWVPSGWMRRSLSVYLYFKLQPLGGVWVCEIDRMLLHVAPLLLCWSCMECSD